MGLTHETWLWVFGSSIALVLLLFVWGFVSKMISLNDDYRTRYPRLGQKLTSKQIQRIKELANEDNEKAFKTELRALIRQALDKEIEPDKIPAFCIALLAVYKKPEAYKKIPDVDDIN